MSQTTHDKGVSDAKEGKPANTAGISDAKDRQDYKDGHEKGKK